MTTIAKNQTSEAVDREQTTVATGAATAAMVASGIGAFVIGLLTTGAVISEGLKETLNWWNPNCALLHRNRRKNARHKGF